MADGRELDPSRWRVSDQERHEVAEVLRSLGVGYGQGWLYGKPAAQPEYRPAAGPAAKAANG